MTISEACPACASEDMDGSFENIDGVCEACGFVVDDIADTNPPERMDYSEVPDKGDQEDWLTVCSIHNATEKRIAVAFDAVEEIGDAIGAEPKIRQKAADIYANGFRAGITDGRETHTFVAAAIRLASAQVDQPIPIGRITALSTVDSHQFRLSRIAIEDSMDSPPSTPQPAEFLPFLTQQLNLDDQDVQHLETLLNDVADESALVGKDPVGIAAAAAYLVADHNSQAEIADTAGVSTETIRLRKNQIQELSSYA